MTVIGYARVSTIDQDLSIQEEALRAAGCAIIRAEKRSGTTTEGRIETELYGRAPASSSSVGWFNG